MRLALERGHDWVWMMDDDAVPRPDALERLMGCPHAGRQDTAYLVSRIISRHGHTQQPPVLTGFDWLGTVLDDGCVRTTLASWLGLLVHERAIRRYGLPIREFFIWNDDLEYTDRITRGLNGYCVLDSVITHYQKDERFDPFLPEDFVKIGHSIRNGIGWIKVSDAPFLKKLVRTGRAAAACVTKVARRQLPVKSLLWLGRGLFLFWPRVEMLGPAARAGRPGGAGERPADGDPHRLPGVG